MSRRFDTAVLPLAVLVVVSPRAAASPPEAVSGAMKLNKVKDGLRQYRGQADDDHRASWVRRVAGISEPWVDVVLGEALSDRAYSVRLNAARGLMGRHYEANLADWKIILEAELVWKQHAGLLRRRAEQAER